MFKELLNKIDKKFAKVCAYVSVTVIVTFIAIEVILASGGFWARLWTIFSAVLKPVIIGGIISYLLSPLVNRISDCFDKKKTHRWSRYLAILLSFLIILSIVALIIVIIALTIYKNISAINFESLLGIADSVHEDTSDFFYLFYD